MIKCKTRLAEDSEAAIIQSVLEETGLLVGGFDWSRINPSWLVAEYKNKIVGCVQICIGYPIGHIQFLAVLPKYQVYGFGVSLWRSAEHYLASSGCDGFQTVADHPCVMKHLKALGGVAFGKPVNWIFKRVAKIKKVSDEENLQSTYH